MRWTYVTMVIGSLALAGSRSSPASSARTRSCQAFLRGYWVYWLIGIAVAFMTAFYTFRMIYLTFHRSWRGPAEAWHHVHERPRTMVAPLVILAVPTALAGLLLGIPPESGPSTLAGGGLPRCRGARDRDPAGIDRGRGCPERGGPRVRVARPRRPAPAHRRRRGRGGIVLARRWYVQDPEAPVRFVERIPFGLGPGMYRASVNKYYFDDLYQLLFARGGVLVERAVVVRRQGHRRLRQRRAGWRSGSAASCAASRPGASRTTDWASPRGW